MDKNLISRTVIAGALLAAVGVGLFVALWIILGNLGFDSFLRLFMSMCIPPALMALGLGVYFILTRKRAGVEPPSE